MKQKLCVCLAILLCFSLIGCGTGKKEDESSDDTATYIYYIGTENIALEKQEYTIQAENQDGQIKELLKELKTTPESIDYNSAISWNVDVVSYSVKERQLELHFNEKYMEMKKSTEVLARAAIVLTMVQVPGIDYVLFYVGDRALKDSTGNPIGLMNSENFVQNAGSSLYSYQVASLILYFSDEEGMKLQKENREEVRYSQNTSVEKLVVEQLMKGPSSDKCSPTIPSTAKLLGVSVKEGICYVNFSATFLTDVYNQKPDVTIYSIVNSIIANGNATKVQILVEGASDAIFMNTIDLSKPLEWNADILKEKETP